MASSFCSRMISPTWGPHSTMESVLASHPAALGSRPGVAEISNEKKLSMLQRLIDSADA